MMRLPKNVLSNNKATIAGDYFAQANSWSTDTYTQAVVWRNWCLLIALLSLLLVIIALLVLLKLLPLKENTPFLVFVEEEKGVPVTIRPTNTGELIENESLKKYMIRKFMHARERYNPATYPADLETVSLLSSPEVVKEYQYQLSANNPLSPSQRYKNAVIDIGDMTITFLNEQRAYVSYHININQEGIYQSIPAHADIKFQFAERAIPDHATQTINPVNFEVLTYQSHHLTHSKETL